MKFSIKDFFRNVTESAENCIFGHILKKPLIKNFIFVQCIMLILSMIYMLYESEKERSLPGQ